MRASRVLRHSGKPEFIILHPASNAFRIQFINVRPSSLPMEMTSKRQAWDGWCFLKRRKLCAAPIRRFCFAMVTLSAPLPCRSSARYRTSVNTSVCPSSMTRSISPTRQLKLRSRVARPRLCKKDSASSSHLLPSARISHSAALNVLSLGSGGPNGAGRPRLNTAHAGSRCRFALFPEW